MRRQNVYAVGIHNHRAVKPFQHRFYRCQRPRGLSQPRADQHRVHPRQPFQNLRNGRAAEHSVFVRERKHNGLRQLHRLNGIDALRNPQKHQSGPAAQRAHRRKRSRAGVAPAAAQQQYLSKSAFMPEGIPIRQRVQNAQPVQFQNCHSITRFFR